MCLCRPLLAFIVNKKILKNNRSTFSTKIIIFHWFKNVIPRSYLPNCFRLLISVKKSCDTASLLWKMIEYLKHNPYQQSCIQKCCIFLYTCTYLQGLKVDDINLHPRMYCMPKFGPLFWLYTQFYKKGIIYIITRKCIYKVLFSWYCLINISEKMCQEKKCITFGVRSLNPY